MSDGPGIVKWIPWNVNTVPDYWSTYWNASVINHYPGQKLDWTATNLMPLSALPPQSQPVAQKQTVNPTRLFPFQKIMPMGGDVQDNYSSNIFQKIFGITNGS